MRISCGLNVPLLSLWLASGTCASTQDHCLLDEHGPASASSATQASSLLQSDARRTEAATAQRPQRKDDGGEVGHHRIRSLESRVRMLESQMTGTEEETDSESTRRSSSKAEGEAVHPVFSKKCSTVEGKQCVFGVDARDEGSHCVPELDYGQFGWCYTKADLSNWGPCTEKCPLSGRFGVLQRKMADLSGKIEELEDEVDDMPDCIKSKEGGKKAPKSGAKTPADDTPSEKTVKKAAKSGAKSPPSDEDSDDTDEVVKKDEDDDDTDEPVKKAAKSGAKKPSSDEDMDNDDGDEKVTKSGAKKGAKTPPEAFVSRHRHKAATSGRKESTRRHGREAPWKARRLDEEAEKPLLSKRLREEDSRAKSHRYH